MDNNYQDGQMAPSFYSAPLVSFPQTGYYIPQEMPYSTTMACPGQNVILVPQSYDGSLVPGSYDGTTYYPPNTTSGFYQTEEPIPQNMHTHYQGYQVGYGGSRGRGQRSRRGQRFVGSNPRWDQNIELPINQYISTEETSNTLTSTNDKNEDVSGLIQTRPDYVEVTSEISQDRDHDFTDISGEGARPKQNVHQAWKKEHRKYDNRSQGRYTRKYTNIQSNPDVKMSDFVSKEGGMDDREMKFYEHTGRNTPPSAKAAIEMVTGSHKYAAYGRKHQLHGNVRDGRYERDDQRFKAFQKPKENADKWNRRPGGDKDYVSDRYQGSYYGNDISGDGWRSDVQRESTRGYNWRGNEVQGFAFRNRRGRMTQGGSRASYSNNSQDTRKLNVLKPSKNSGSKNISEKDGRHVNGEDFKLTSKKKDMMAQNKKSDPENRENQRSVLIEQLSSSMYECMVCCEVVRQDVAVWSCSNCFHVFHLGCIKRWARSPSSAVDASGGWRCPTCQNECRKMPNQYRCFCGKVKNPLWNRQETPHSCGEMCKKERPGCPHPCNILCHPGPCPTCHATVTKHCDCTKTKQTVKCGQAALVKCDQICSKTLNCGKHACKEICHAGPCDPCGLQSKQDCFCGQSSRTVICGTTESFTAAYSCNQPCNRSLGCEKHQCQNLCHPGPCAICALLPSEVLYCPCGKQSLADMSTGQARMSCTDPVPTCGQSCLKELNCGPPDSRHRCQRACHDGECGPCEGVTDVGCRCGAYEKEMLCFEAAEYSDINPFKCDKRCTKKKHCGRHRCGQHCCTDTEHKCEQKCGQKLSCGLHRCEESCHCGKCPTCWHVSFDELRCHCGTEVIYPPIPCGTAPPDCLKLCIREHPCGHAPVHNCHSDEQCPPCTVLMEKYCTGQHELRKNIPCYVNDISCGMPCNKPLSCRRHKCLRTCHKGLCLEEGESCKQPCLIKRESCEHPCNAQCHEGEPCPKTACRAQISIKCECGNRSENATCGRGGARRELEDYQRMATSLLAMKIAEAQNGQSVDISALVKDSDKPRRLECNQECGILERNRRLALALEIKNPDLSSKLGNPPYNQFLKDYCKQNTAFVAKIETTLSELVQTAQKSKQPRRSYAFAPMKSDQRKFVHELAEFYGCETQSYDEEPKKNVVATAYRNKCWHPSVTLTALVQREMHRAPPTPIPHGSKESDVRSALDAAKKSTGILGAWGQSRSTAPPGKTASTGKSGMTSLGSLSSKASSVKQGKPTTPAIDYFEMTE